jgi:hypothetical protein
MTGRTAPAVGALVELEFLPPAVPRWERGVVHSVTEDARYFYVSYAYAAHGEDMYKVDVECSSWRRARNAKRKRKAQCVGTGKATPNQNIEKLKVKRADGMGHGVFVVAEDSRRIADHLENAARNACCWIYMHRENISLLGRCARYIGNSATQ